MYKNYFNTIDITSCNYFFLKSYFFKIQFIFISINTNNKTRAKKWFNYYKINLKCCF